MTVFKDSTQVTPYVWCNRMNKSANGITKKENTLHMQILGKIIHHKCDVTMFIITFHSAFWGCVQSANDAMLH